MRNTNYSHRGHRDIKLCKSVFIRVHSWLNNPVILSKKTGFTLIELMVAVGILGMMIAFSSVIFRFSIEAHRVAAANAEIMQKLRVITGQLNDDFRGLRKDAPMLVWFEQDDKDDDPNRFDQIMFFADGDFSSVQLYRKNEDPVTIDDTDQKNAKVIRGNVARIQYALAQSDSKMARAMKDTKERILARRVHILTADGDLIDWPDPCTFDDFDNEKNDSYEHDRISLARWLIAEKDAYGNHIIQETFDKPPKVDTESPATFHLLMSEAVGSFAIQWAYWEKPVGGDWELRWFPSDDPDSNGDDEDSHFEINKGASDDGFGVYFSTYEEMGLDKWNKITELEYDTGDPFIDGFFPDAMKFTFRLYDSKGVIKGGRTFSHIVYLSD